jgi:hypothetical protein
MVVWIVYPPIWNNPMFPERYPFFRKQFIPWYDTNAVCWTVMGLVFLVFLFGLSGMAMALSEPHLSGHIWFPALLTGLCGFLTVKIGIRLWRRNRHD